MTAMTVLSAGPSTLIQDLGRPGLARIGVGAAGAMDRAAHALANRLLGNPEEAATLEILFGGTAVRADGDLWIAVTGAWGAVDVDGRPLAAHTSTPVADGAVVRFGPAQYGIRYTLAVRGGIDVPPVLGSRSRDTLAALGPAPLADGDSLPLGPTPPAPIPPIDHLPIDPPPAGLVELEVSRGPRADWFTSAADAVLRNTEWTVSPRSDRTGIRLEGPPLERAPSGELPSEGMLPGSIQVSPDGAPTILGVDAPVTGGYPVIAVVADASLDRLAQLRPGQRVRLRARATR